MPSLTYRSNKGSRLTPTELDNNFRSLDGRIATLERIIRVTDTGNVTSELQAAIDAAGADVAILFDTPSCELWGLDIANKNSVTISTTGQCKLKLPSGTYDAHSADQTTCQIYFDNVKSLRVRGPLIIDQSAGTFNRPTGAQTIKWAWYVSCQNGRTCDIQGVANDDGALGGVLVDNRATGNLGYHYLKLIDLQSDSCPCIVKVQGRMRALLIDNIIHEDPTAIGKWASDKFVPPVYVTADASDTDDHCETVCITNVFTKWGITGAQVDRAEHIAMRNIISDGYGYTWNGTTRTAIPTEDFAGGPIMQVKNLFWNPDLQSAKTCVVTEMITRNTNRANNAYIALTVGLGGDQDLTYSLCKFDAPVKVVGASAPDRTGGHPGYGWTRFATLRACTFYDTVEDLGNFASIENCKFFGPTIVDPTISTSQHDTIGSSFDTNQATMPTLLTLGPDTSITRCIFYGAKIAVSGDIDGTLMSGCTFLFGSFLDVAADVTGTLEIKNPHELTIKSASPSGSPVFNVRNPTGTTTLTGTTSYITQYAATIDAP